jgi:hypothetical protein
MRDRTTRQTLKVRDAENPKEALANFKRVWREKHPENKKRPGRPTERDLVLKALREVILRHVSPEELLQPKWSQRRCIELVQQYFLEHPGEISPCPDTIYKHIKTLLLVNKTLLFGRSLSPQQICWLNKHQPGIMEALKRFNETREAANADANAQKRDIPVKLTHPMFRNLSGLKITERRFPKDTQKKITMALTEFAREVAPYLPRPARIVLPSS